MSTDLNASHDAAKHAIDLRLDTIDRALLGYLPRHERIEIVGQIETKLRESAGESTAGGVLDDIARDRADRQEERLDSAGDRSAVYLRERPFSARRKPRSRLALASGILGIIALTALAALPFTYIVVSTIIDDTTLQISFLGGHLATVLLGGLLAIALGIAALVLLNRRGGRLVGHGWAITGLCTGPLPLFAGGLVALVVGSELWGSVSVTPAYSTAPVTSPSPPVAADPYGSSSLPGAYPAPMSPAIPTTTSLGDTPASPSYQPPQRRPDLGDRAPMEAAEANGAGCAPTPSYSLSPAPDAPPPAVAPATASPAIPSAPAPAVAAEASASPSVR